MRLSSAPVFLCSKKQSGVEISSFGSELIAVKKLCEFAQCLAYKLRTAGAACEGPARARGDDQSALGNTTVPLH